VRVVVNANLGAAAEAPGALDSGAEGCGLLRTEFLFLDRLEPPSEEEQLREYQRIADALQGRPLAIRTMDVGGDKPLAYLPAPHEENPALGLRGIRASLARPQLLRDQLRAIARVRPAGQCRVLLPMVTDLDEILQVRALLAECARETAMPEPMLGVMVETPACALLADQLVGTVDFFSIGTNDLSQYTLAIDRGHRELGQRLDALHPAVLRLIAHVADVARDNGKEVAVCGALAADADAAPLLVGLGVHELSVAPAMIPRVKRVLRMLDAGACARLAREAMQQSSAAAVRALAGTSRPRNGAPIPQSANGG
jgi:multiphosphoryl transfer protein